MNTTSHHDRKECDRASRLVEAVDRSAVHRVLKPDGTFWLAIGDEYAAELKIASQEIGFTCRSWVIWYYTFGVNCTNKFSRSHAHLFYFVKDPKRFTFRAEELENRIPSARQLVYADKRANPDGRLPDDTWVLRPQDLADCFTAGEDTWYVLRVAGIALQGARRIPRLPNARTIVGAHHPHLLAVKGELEIDPFSGSATSVAVVKKPVAGIIWVSTCPQEYVTRVPSPGWTRSRPPGDPLDGPGTDVMALPRRRPRMVRRRNG